MAVSVDGKLSDQLPQSRPDSGQAEKCVSPTSRPRFWSTRKLTSGKPLRGVYEPRRPDRQMVSVLTHFAPDY